jgi:hypothetical protein
MISESSNGERLKGSQLGYRGKGVPDAETIEKLQHRYSAAVEAGGLSPEIRSKLKRMRALGAKARRGVRNKINPSEIAKVWKEAAGLAAELAPILHFKVDDVDWDK